MKSSGVVTTIKQEARSPGLEAMQEENISSSTGQAFICSFFLTPAALIELLGGSIPAKANTAWNVIELIFVTL